MIGDNRRTECLRSQVELQGLDDGSLQLVLIEKWRLLDFETGFSRARKLILCWPAEAENVPDVRRKSTNEKSGAETQHLELMVTDDYLWPFKSSVIQA